MPVHDENYEQKIGYARGSLWAPFHAVGMVARIAGDVPPGLLDIALCKLRILYPPLASRVRMEEDGSAWLTTKDVGAFPVEVRSKISDDDWIRIFLEQEQIPFKFDCGPLARFFLLRGNPSTDLIVIVPHVICEGYSMTYVMADAVALLNDSHRKVTLPSPPPVPTWQNVSHSWSDNLLLRGFIRMINQVWPDGPAVMRQADFEEVNRFYWARRRSGLLASELSPEETTDLITRCRSHGVSVTGALVAAFLLAQADVLPAKQKKSREIAVAVNIRDRMLQPTGRVVGVYASNISVTMRPNPGTSFWKLAREGHTRIHNALQDRQRILWPLAIGELNPALTDTLLAALCTDRWSRQLGVFTHLVRMGGMNPDLDISNIGRVDLPDVGSPYRMEKLIPLPPLVPGGGLALNVLTVDGRMSLILKFRHDQFDSADILKIKDRAIGYLLGAQ